MPQVIVNKHECREAIEGLELSLELAKQVLSQLSYTPIFSTLLILPYLSHTTQLACASLWG